MAHFFHNNYEKIRRSVGELVNSQKSAEFLPRFLQCLVLPRETKKKKEKIATVSDLKDDLIKECLGLSSISIRVLADSLLNQLAPAAIPKLYVSNQDPLRPQWMKPTFIVVHASQHFHFPVTIKKAMLKRIKVFRSRGNPVAFLIHNDGFNDASYFVRPNDGDLASYTETRKYPFCENCQEVTFAGGYIDWCLGLAVRTYIANYFRNHSTGEIRINLAADSIYTELKGPPGSEGAVTAQAEIEAIGKLKFIRNRIGPYLSNVKLNHIDEALCPMAGPKSDVYKKKQLRG